MAEAVALIDYGAGNLHSVKNALGAAGARHIAVTADPDIVYGAQRIVLPGVGAFRTCYEGLTGIAGMVEALEQRVLTDGVPFLGICVGLQLLATRGFEHGECPGLGWIPGDVRRIRQADATIRVPHMGWNDVMLTPHHSNHDLMRAGEAYFLHSYHFMPEDGRDIAAMTDHGGGIVAAVARRNIVGVQFHPEKSQTFGIALLERFLEWMP